MHKHLQLGENGVIIGINYLSVIEQGLPELAYISADSPLYARDDIFGWTYNRETGEAVPPPPPSEAEALQAEKEEVTARLMQIFQAGQFAAFLGEDAIEPTPIQVMGAGLRSLPPAMTEKERLIARLNEIKARLAELED